MHLEKKENSASKLGDRFRQFCESSSIHGTNFINLHQSIIGKTIWVLVVTGGILLALVVINRSIDQWEKHPIITSVAQISIEQIEFPSVTVCSLDDSRYKEYSFMFNHKVTTKL